MGEIERANQDCEQEISILHDTLGKEAAFSQQLQDVCDDIKKQ